MSDLILCARCGVSNPRSAYWDDLAEAELLTILAALVGKSLLTVESAWTNVERQG